MALPQRLGHMIIIGDPLGELPQNLSISRFVLPLAIKAKPWFNDFSTIQDEIMIDIEDFMKWLSVHKQGINLRYDEHGREHDLGYIQACEVIEAELRAKMEEGLDGGEVD